MLKKKKKRAFQDPAGRASRSSVHPAGWFGGLGRPRAAARTSFRRPSRGSRPTLHRAPSSRLAASPAPAASPGPRQLAENGCLRRRQAPAGRRADGQPAPLTSPSGVWRRPGPGNLAQACLRRLQAPSSPEPRRLGLVTWATRAWVPGVLRVRSQIRPIQKPWPPASSPWPGAVPSDQSSRGERG